MNAVVWWQQDKNGKEAGEDTEGKSERVNDEKKNMREGWRES